MLHIEPEDGTPVSVSKPERPAENYGARKETYKINDVEHSRVRALTPQLDGMEKLLATHEGALDISPLTSILVKLSAVVVQLHKLNDSH